MLAESLRLEEQINSIQTQMKTLPEGKLIYGSNGEYYQWYQSFGKDRKYIPKKEKYLAEQLAYKKYLSYLLEDLSREKKAVDSYLEQHQNNIKASKNILTDMPEYRELLSPYFSPKSQELQDWMHSAFEQNPQNKENLIHKASSGNWVRSKSEAIIDMVLYTNHIPFRYECKLQLGRVTLYPDFTIRHPRTGKLYYWEHFGMMDDETYSKKTCSKIQTYARNGIYPSINLIATFETKEHPLSAEMVMKIVEYYFK